MLAGDLETGAHACDCDGNKLLCAGCATCIKCLTEPNVCNDCGVASLPGMELCSKCYLRAIQEAERK